MGKKDASATRLPVDQYRKQIGKQDYKKTKSALKATRLKAEAKKSSSGFKVLSSLSPGEKWKGQASEMKSCPACFPLAPSIYHTRLSFSPAAVPLPASTCSMVYWVTESY
uniref:Triple QxxK/R motif-containing protein n=1 Tax=Amphiprion ocellaris TaxID=80972 RepID=A0AAQ5Z1S5_AMPOC